MMEAVKFQPSPRLRAGGVLTAFRRLAGEVFAVAWVFADHVPARAPVHFKIPEAPIAVQSKLFHIGVRWTGAAGSERL